MNETCSQGACTRQARLAVTTSRPSRGTIWTKVWWDNRTAPPTADRFCKKHGIELLKSLTETLCDMDDDEA